MKGITSILLSFLIFVNVLVFFSICSQKRVERKYQRVREKVENFLFLECCFVVNWNIGCMLRSCIYLFIYIAVKNGVNNTVSKN